MRKAGPRKGQNRPASKRGLLLEVGPLIYILLGVLLLLVQKKPQVLVFLFPLISTCVYASLNAFVFTTLLAIVVFYHIGLRHTREKKEAFDLGLSCFNLHLTRSKKENEDLNLILKSYIEEKEIVGQTMKTLEQSNEHLKLANARFWSQIETLNSELNSFKEDKNNSQQTMLSFQQDNENLRLTNSWYFSQYETIKIELKRSTEENNKSELTMLSYLQANETLQRLNSQWSAQNEALKLELRNCKQDKMSAAVRFNNLGRQYKNQIDTLTLETVELRSLKGDKKAIEKLDMKGLQSLKSTLRNSSHIVRKEIEEKFLYEKLQEEKIKLKEELNCVICLEKPYNIAFIPCGHNKVCSECSSKITSCPFCRKRITGRLVTF